MSQTLQFLEALHGEAAGHVVISVPRGRGYRSWWHETSDLDRAAQRAIALADEHDVYVSVNPQDQAAALAEKQRRLDAKGEGRQARLASTRGFVSTTAALTCVWFELDYHAAGAHAEEALPTRGEAERFVGAALPLQPSVVNHSGHGFHLYWLQSAPSGFRSEDEREAAKGLVRRAQRHLQALGSRHGWNSDTTSDLTRVLRPPGTLNHKLPPPKPVEPVVFEPARRYTLAELAAAFPEPVMPERELAEEDVRVMLRCLPGRVPYEDWFRVSAAVYDAVGRDLPLAIALLKERWPEEEPGEYHAKLTSDLDGSITAGTLVHYARQHGYVERTHGALTVAASAPAESAREAPRVPVTIHDPLGERDAVTEPPRAVPLWGFELPAPLAWLVELLIPQGFVTLLAADGGTGKSYLAILLALCVALGRPFLGQRVRRAPVLYVDYELDEDEQKRRVWRVARGMGMDVLDPALEGHFFYHRPTAPLSKHEAHDGVVRLVREHGIGLVILDSLTIGSGADATSQQDVTVMMQRFKEWGTVFAIDHVSGLGARGNASRARPFGSVFKRNIARSTFTLAKSDTGGLLLHSDKNNFGPERDLLCYEMTFGEDEVAFRRLDLSDEAMAGAMHHLTTYQVTLLAVQAVYAETGLRVTAEEVVAWRADHDEAGPVKAGTVKNHFTKLRRDGDIVLDDGCAIPMETRHDGAANDRDERTRNRPVRAGNGDHDVTAPIGIVNRDGTSGDGIAGAAPFHVGQVVRTPDGEGEVQQVFEGRVTVRIGDRAEFYAPSAVEPVAPF